MTDKSKEILGIIMRGMFRIIDIGNTTLDHETPYDELSQPEKDKWKFMAHHVIEVVERLKREEDAKVLQERRT